MIENSGANQKRCCIAQTVAIVVLACTTIVFFSLFIWSIRRDQNKNQDPYPEIEMSYKDNFVRSALDLNDSIKSNHGESIQDLINAFKAQEDEHEVPDFANQHDEKKYFKRTCDSDEGMWGNDVRDNLHFMLDHASQIMGFDKEKEVTVFDWGAGCGFMMRYLKELYPNTKMNTFGLDLNPANMQWAREKLYLDYAVGKDGSDIDWIPDKSVDRIISVASIYHIPKNLQMTLLRTMVGKLKKDGMIWIGWHGTGGNHMDEGVRHPTFFEEALKDFEIKVKVHYILECHLYGKMCIHKQGGYTTESYSVFIRRLE